MTAAVGSWLAHHTDTRFEIRVSGSGGQGILVAAAIARRRGRGHGPGGRADAELRAGGPRRSIEGRGRHQRHEPIDYPEVRSADLSLCMSQAAFDKYAAGTRPGGLIIYDAGLIHVGELAAVVLAGSEPRRRIA